MAYSLQREVSDGSLQYVNITIQYFDKKDLFVYKDELVIPKTSDEPSAEWSYVWDGDRIKINKVVPIGAEILVRRKTPYAEPMHIYRQGAVFKDSTMDDNFLQMLFINQENAEGLTATDFYNDLDFHGYRLKNVGAAKVGTDAVPYSQYVADAGGANQNRIAAEQARDTTEGFKAGAQTAMATAKEWANKLGATVDATEYSAKYYSIKANEYSVSAKNSKDAAAVSETNALQSKNDTALLKTKTQQIVDQAQGSLDKIAEINSLANDVKGARLPVGALVPFPVEGNYPGYIKTGSSFDKVAYPQLAALFPSGQIPARNENGVIWYIKAADTVGQPEVIQAQDLVSRVAALEAKVAVNISNITKNTNNITANTNSISTLTSKVTAVENVANAAAAFNAKFRFEF
jgi:hypothetical protein